MRSLLWISLLVCGLAVWAQNSKSPSPPPPSKSQTPASASESAPQANPNLQPPRSDSVNIRDLDNAGPGESSSKETQIDLSPPADDAKAHPKSSGVGTDESAPNDNDVTEFHPWDPHRAAKDIEVGDFYFKRKNYVAAESRYREALYYKDNDAMATVRLAECLEKMDRPDEAREVYENYLKILPHGPRAEDVNKALQRLTSPAANAKPSK